MGDAASLSSLSPPEGSAEADHCNRLYPIARDAMFEAYNWSFLTRREALAELDTETFGWRHAYAVPTDMLHAIAVFGSDDKYCEHSWDFQIERVPTGALLLTDCPQAVLRYTQKTDAAERFSPLFADALAWLLASYLAGAVIRGNGGAQVAKSLYQNFQLTLQQAIQRDVIQRQKRSPHYPAWMRFRRGLVHGSD
jgi:hypothetical protein